MDGSPIGLLLALTYGSVTPVITPNVFVYGTADTDSSPASLSSGSSLSSVDTDSSPGTLKNPTISGNVSSRQGNQSANSGGNTGTIRGTE